MNDLKKYKCNFIEINSNDIYYYSDITDNQFDFVQSIFSKIIDNITNLRIDRVNKSSFLYNEIIIISEFYMISLELDKFSIFVKEKNNKWWFEIVEASNKQNTLENISIDNLIQKYTDFFSIFDTDNKLITYLLLTNKLK